jgi:ribosomal protein S18 acetylase RimI-like enzyme
MDAAEFATYHAPALATDEVRHSVLLAILARLDTTPGAVLYWTLGGPGACAVKSGPHAIVIGDLDRGQSRALAETTAVLDYPGVIGPDVTAQWFAERAEELGLRFDEPVRQRIHMIREPPRYPGASGFARSAEIDDLRLIAEWMTAFIREAVPRDLPPRDEELEAAIRERNFLLWVDANRPVSMARIMRRLSDSAAISSVYTPPELRERGYAGSVTAAIVERIYAEGRRTACLYTDLSNPASNRCYARIGFKVICGSLHYCRQRKDES